MRNLSPLLRAFIVALLTLMTAMPGAAQGTRTLTVFAAASLTDAFEDLGTQFAQQVPGVDVVLSFGNSTALAQQILDGAPADVFASAGVSQMQTARDGGVIAGFPRVFAGNRLAVVVPADNPADIQALEDLARPGIALVLVAPGTPVRIYTEQMLDLATEAFGGEGPFRSAVLANLISDESNVRQAVAKVALGEADATIVYETDVSPDVADQVVGIPIPVELNVTAVYPIAPAASAADPALARQFVDFVLSEAGQDILDGWGFVRVDGPELLVVEGDVANPLLVAPEDVPALAGEGGPEPGVMTLLAALTAAQPADTTAPVLALDASGEAITLDATAARGARVVAAEDGFVLEDEAGERLLAGPLRRLVVGADGG